MHQLTIEQAAIVAAAGQLGNLNVQAGAGTGKTSTLVHVADALNEHSGLYIAFNKAIVVEARQRFNTGVYCSTAHSLAFRAVVTPLLRQRLATAMPSWDQAKVLGIRTGAKFGEAEITASMLATLARNTVKRFCHSAATEVAPWHVPHVPGTEEHRQQLVELVLPFARKYWADVTAKTGKLPVDHDHYLKVWGLTNPVLPYGYVLVDEAQDLNPVLADIVGRQRIKVIKVGDSAQAIYGWRGAIDAMTTGPGVTELYLSRSFRFGQPVADVANLWLAHTGSPLTLTGFDGIDSRLVDYTAFRDQPHAILCRTNAGVISEAMDQMARGRKVAVVGGVAEILKLVEAADKLIAGKRTEHPDLAAFTSWDHVKEYVEEHGADEPDLNRLVALVNEHGTGVLIRALRRCVDETIADVVVSTAHKAKGREWDNVRVAGDFREPKPTPADPEPKISPAEAMLAYVTVTRARKNLDQGGLAWIENWS